MKPNEIIIWVLIGVVLGASLTAILYSHNHIMLPIYNWKCKQAIVMDDLPSKTECVIYIRKERM